jgi:hypothetical protein
MPGAKAFVDGFIADIQSALNPRIDDIFPVTAEGEGVGPSEAALAADNNTATFWLADPAAGSPTLTVEFEGPFRLGGLVVHAGSTTESDFTLHRRPRTLELTFPGSGQATVELELTDTSDAQILQFETGQIESIVIEVTEFFESGPGGDQIVALREIEFKERR